MKYKYKNTKLLKQEDTKRRFILKVEMGRMKEEEWRSGRKGIRHAL